MFFSVIYFLVSLFIHVVFSVLLDFPWSPGEFVECGISALNCSKICIVLLNFQPHVNISFCSRRPYQFQREQSHEQNCTSCFLFCLTSANSVFVSETKLQAVESESNYLVSLYVSKYICKKIIFVIFFRNVSQSKS